MLDIAEIKNIYEIQIQRHYFKMETPFDREVVPVLPEKYEYNLRHYKENPKLKLRCLKTDSE